MRHRTLYALGFAALVMTGVAAGRAEAQRTWDQQLTCTAPATCPRFSVLSTWNSAAVLDRETGLLWEKSPSTSTFQLAPALSHCNTLTISHRKGWRLPAIQELASLVDGDPANSSSPRLPPGHPFQNVQSSVYRTATILLTNPNDHAWSVNFTDGDVDNSGNDTALYAWCVRSGPGPDTQ